MCLRSVGVQKEKVTRADDLSIYVSFGLLAGFVGGVQTFQDLGGDVQALVGEHQA